MLVIRTEWKSHIGISNIPNFTVFELMFMAWGEVVFRRPAWNRLIKCRVLAVTDFGGHNFWRDTGTTLAFRPMYLAYINAGKLVKWKLSTFQRLVLSHAQRQVQWKGCIDKELHRIPSTGCFKLKALVPLTFLLGNCLGRRHSKV